MRGGGRGDVLPRRAGVFSAVWWSNGSSRSDRFGMIMGGVKNDFKHAASMIANEDQAGLYSLIGRT